MENGYFIRTWTNLGEVLVSFGMEIRPQKASNPQELDRIACGSVLVRKPGFVPRRKPHSEPMDSVEDDRPNVNN